MKGAKCLKLGALALVGAFAMNSFGQVITLTDDTSTVNLLNDGSAGAGTAFDWYIGNTDHLYQESYFYRFGNGGAMSAFGTLGSVSGVQLASNLAQFTYAGQGLRIDVLYALVGSSNTADLAETVRIRNTGRTALHFEFIEYDDFDLNGTIGDDTAVRNNANSISQFDSNTAIYSEVVTAPPANFTECNGFPTILNNIQAAGFTNLNSANNFYHGDATFAFQWVMTLNPGDVFLMSKDKLLTVPEPSSIAAFAGLAIVALRRRNRK